MAAAKPLKPLRAYWAEGSVVTCKLTVGATGAVTSFNGYGVYSITRDSTGTYSIVLEEQHAYLVGASIMELYSSGEDITFQIISEDVNNATLASRKIVVECKAAAAATDPSSGALVYFTFFFCDSKKLGFGPTRS